MTTSIFIKTCKKDLEWLKYCLRSIWKFGSGFEEVVIVADQSCDGQMAELPLNTSMVILEDSRLFYVRDWPNGYIQQQYIKLYADDYTDSDQILFVDSDCVFTMPFSPESYMRDGKPILLKTKYGNLGGAEAWKAITEGVVGWPVEYEYMRRLPWMYKRSTLIAFREMFPELPEKLRSITNHSFSEFNCLGAFIDKHENYQYYISDTDVWMPEKVAFQYWSWGPLTQAIRDEIEEVLA